jgi:hypothetical protein
VRDFFNENLGRIVVFGILGAIAFGGSWMYSGIVMDDRIKAFLDDVDTISYDRGGRVPEVTRVRQQVEQMAVTHRVGIADLSITTSTGTGLGRGGTVAQAAIDARASQLGIAVPQMSADTITFYVRASASVGHGLRSRTQPVDSEITLRTSAIRLNMPGGPALGAHPSREFDVQRGLVGEP